MFELLYDGDFVDMFDSFECAKQRIRDHREDFEQDKVAYPHLYDESEAFPMERYAIFQQVEIGEI